MMKTIEDQLNYFRDSNLAKAAQAVLLSTFMLAGPVNAQEIWSGGNQTWTNPDSDSWSGSTYNNGDAVQFNGAGLGIVTVSGTVAPSSVSVNTTGNYTFSGGTINTTGDFRKLNTGTLTLNNTTTSIGANFEAARGPTVLAGTSTTTVDGNLRVTNSTIGGGGSFGTLSVQDSAALTVAGAFHVGQNNNHSGSVTQSGGTVTLNGTSNLIGYWSNLSGTYTMSGGTLNVPNSYLTAGWDGQGYINLNGGTANLEGLRLGYGNNGARTGVVTLDGGTLNIGSLGIIKEVGTVNLTSGTLGALDNWNSAGNVNMTLNGAANGSSLDIDTTGGNIALNGALSGSGGFTKIGDGTLFLGNNNSYAGDTKVTQGTLEITGTYSGAGTTTVDAGATFEVNGGTVSLGAVEVDGMFSPGIAQSIATATLGALSLNNDSTYQYSFDGDAGVYDYVDDATSYASGLYLSSDQSDLLSVTSLALGTTVDIEINSLGGEAVTANKEFVLFSIANAGATFSLPAGALNFVGGQFTQLGEVYVEVKANAGPANEDLIVLRMEAKSIPEPSSLMLLGLGVGLLTRMRKFAR